MCHSEKTIRARKNYFFDDALNVMLTEHSVVDAAGACGLSVWEGKLESRPTVTRLSLGCLILDRVPWREVEGHHETRTRQHVWFFFGKENNSSRRVILKIELELNNLHSILSRSAVTPVFPMGVSSAASA